MLNTPGKIPAHERIYRRLHDMILFGDLSPGQSVTIQGLVTEFGVSMTPVREAIRRLTAEGALEFRGNRRVSLPVMTAAHFDELCFARLQIEPKLAEIATKNATPADIDALRRIDDRLNEAIAGGDTKAYMLHNYRFHFSLYELSRSAILIPITETLWMRYGPLYRIIAGRHGTGNLDDKHDEALIALAKNDADAVGQAIRADIQQGLEIVEAEIN